MKKYLWMSSAPVVIATLRVKMGNNESFVTLALGIPLFLHRKVQSTFYLCIWFSQKCVYKLQNSTQNKSHNQGVSRFCSLVPSPQLLPPQPPPHFQHSRLLYSHLNLLHCLYAILVLTITLLSTRDENS